MIRTHAKKRAHTEKRETAKIGWWYLCMFSCLHHVNIY